MSRDPPICEEVANVRRIVASGGSSLNGGPNHALEGPNHTLGGLNHALVGPNHAVEGPNHALEGLSHALGGGGGSEPRKSTKTTGEFKVPICRQETPVQSCFWCRGL